MSALPGELGTDGTHKVSEEYQGVAMTLIDTMSTLAILGNTSEFQKNTHWLTNNVRPPPLLSLSQQQPLRTLEACSKGKVLWIVHITPGHDRKSAFGYEKDDGIILFV